VRRYEHWQDFSVCISKRELPKTVTFSLRDRDLSIVDESGVRRIIPGDIKVWVGGGQPVTGRAQPPSAGAETKFRLTSAATLPN